MPQNAMDVQGARQQHSLPGFLHRVDRPAYWFLLLGVPALCVAWVLLTVPLSQPMSNYWTDASSIVKFGWLGQRFTPSGYPLTMALSMVLMRAHPEVGFALEQGIFHLVLVLLLWLVMRRLHATPAAALLGTLVLQADPELLLSVEKVWDVAFSTWLFLLIAWLALRVLQDGATVSNCAWLGAALAFGSFDRPNYVSLLPALVAAVWFAGPRPAAAERSSNRVLHVVVAVLVFVVAYAGLSLLTYRELRTPNNGAYNLFAGNNQFTRAALVEHLNAEPSIVPALAADGVVLGERNPADPSLVPFYRQASRQFARQHPAEELELASLKLWTMLRPDTKVHALRTPAGAGKVLLALFVPVWLVALLLLHRQRMRLEPGDWLIIAIAALYFVPFLMTNADPRFRTPLDILLGAHTVALLWRTGRRGASPARESTGRTMERTSFSG